MPTAAKKIESAVEMMAAKMASAPTAPTQGGMWVSVAIRASLGSSVSPAVLA